MEDKIAKDLVKQLTRIADALEKSNQREEIAEKRRVKLEKLEERNYRADLREKLGLNSEVHTSPVTPRLED